MSDDKEEEVKTEMQAQLVFECAVCEKTFNHPGMCQACHAILKPRGG
jgi:hypothetical protein